MGGSPSRAGELMVGGRLLASRVCGEVGSSESGVSGVRGEYTDWDTAGTWWAVVTPPDAARGREELGRCADNALYLILHYMQGHIVGLL